MNKKQWYYLTVINCYYYISKSTCKYMVNWSIMQELMKWFFFTILYFNQIENVCYIVILSNVHKCSCKPAALLVSQTNGHTHTRAHTHTLSERVLSALFFLTSTWWMAFKHTLYELSIHLDSQHPQPDLSGTCMNVCECVCVCARACVNQMWERKKKTG